MKSNAEYHQQSKEKRNAYSRAYRNKYRDRVNAIQRKSNERPKRRFDSTRYSAKKRNLEFSLTLEQYTALIGHPCYYCEGLLSKQKFGLDRVDSNKGYTMDNVVPCCRNCNVLKSNFLTQGETKKVIALLRELRGGVAWAEAK